MIPFAVCSPCRVSITEEHLGICAAEGQCVGADSDGNSERTVRIGTDGNVWYFE